MTALGVSSSHAASEIDSGSHVSTAVHPTVANSIASSTHSTAQTSDAAAASGPASRLGQDQGQLEHAPGHAGNSPDDAAGVRGVEQMNSGWNTVSSAADNGRQGFAPQQGFVQDQSEALRPESVQSAFFATSNAAGGGAAAGAFPGHQAGNSPDVRLDQSQAKTSDAGSVQSTSRVVLSANGASSSGQLAEAPLQHDSQRQMPTEPDQAISAGAVLTQAQRQPQMAPPGGEAEQRKVEEQEVLYNMTGQTGSLMYMAPEVYFVNHLDCGIEIMLSLCTMPGLYRWLSGPIVPTVAHKVLHNAGMQHTDALRMHNISLCALSLMKFALPD